MKVLIIILCFSIFTYTKPSMNKQITRKEKQNSFKKYPKLGIDTIQSDNYKLIKIEDYTNGYMSDGARFLPELEIFVFNAGFGSYWRLNKNGNFLDAFSDDVNMHNCGVFFHKNYYIDWALTGESKKKQYKEYINGDTLSALQFEQYLKKAEIITYEFRDSAVMCLLKIDNAWIAIVREIIYGKNSIYENSKDLALQGHQTKNDTVFTIIDNTIIPFYDWKDASNPIIIKNHIRRIRVRKPFFSYDINNTIRKRGWEATGYFHWKINQDTLKFQAYTFEKTEKYLKGLIPNMSIYQIPSKPDLAFFIVGAGRGDRVSEEIGFYVMKKK